MSKVNLSTLSTLVNDASACATLNANFASLQAALDIVLWRDGTSPNALTATLDCNSQRIVNLPSPSTATEPARKGDLDAITIAATAGAILPGSVTGSQIATGTITSNNIQDGSIATADFADYSVATAKLANNAVDNTKLAQMAAHTVKANPTGAAANAQDATVTALLDDAFGNSQGNILYRGASSWVSLAPGSAGQFLKTQGASANPAWASPPTSAIPNLVQGLYIKNTSATNINITASSAYLNTSGGVVAFVNSAINVTVSLSVTGANGIDTGAKANSTWYYTYLIYNGSTVAGLASTSSTSPTLPSGYTYFMRVGSFYVNSSGSVNASTQAGRRIQYLATSSNGTGLPTIASGSTSGTVSSFNTGAYVPATSSEITASLGMNIATGTTIIVALGPNSAINGNYGVTGIAWVFPSTSGYCNSQGTFVLESRNIYFQSNVSSAIALCVGYLDSVNAL